MEQQSRPEGPGPFARQRLVMGEEAMDRRAGARGAVFGGGGGGSCVGAARARGPAPRLRRPAPLGAFRTSLLPRVEAAGISLPPQRANSRYLLLGGGVPPRFWRWAAKIFRVIFSWSASVSSRNWQPYSVLAPSFSMTRST